MRCLAVWAAALLLAALCFTPQGCGQQRDLTGVQGASLIRSSDSSSSSGSGRSDSSSTTGDSAGSGSRSRGRSAAAAAATDQQSKVASYAQLLQRLHSYQSELPPSLLSQAVGLQGDTRRLQRSLLKMIRGEPVKIALLGGSLSMRGWNHADEAYMSQVHKWLEITLQEGCREEAQRTASPAAPAAESPADSGSGSSDNGKRKSVAARGLFTSRTTRPAAPTAESSPADSGRGSNDNSKQNADTAAQGLFTSHTSHAAAPTDLPRGSITGVPLRTLKRKDPFPYDPHPSLDPENDLHVRSHAGYLASHHMCGGSNIELFNLAVPAAGPGYAERCALPRLPEDVDLVFLDFGCNDYHESKYFSHPERHAYERILRYALSRPRAPAVVLFEAFSWAQSGGDYFGGGGQAVGSGAPPVKRGSLGQDKHTLLAEYYGEVQVLSVRSALWQILNATSHPQRLIYVPNDDPRILSDFLHVSLFGHRWYADIIIHYLRSQITTLVAKLIAADVVSSSLASSGSAPSGRAGGRAGPAGEGEEGEGEAEEGEEGEEEEGEVGSDVDALMQLLLGGGEGSVIEPSQSQQRRQQLQQQQQQQGQRHKQQRGDQQQQQHQHQHQQRQEWQPPPQQGRQPQASHPTAEEEGEQVWQQHHQHQHQHQQQGRRQDGAQQWQLQQQHGRQLQASHPTAEGEDGEEGPSGGSGEGSGPSSQVTQCQVQGTRGHSYPVACSSTLPGLPPPLFPGNEVHALGLCAVGEELKELAEKAAAGEQEGWEWVDEGKGNIHKWGFVSTQVGAELTIAVPLDPSLLSEAQAAQRTPARPRPNAPAPVAPHMLAWLIYLQSYKGMGSAAVSCGGGCRCAPFVVDAHRGARQSVPALKSFKIYPGPPPPDAAEAATGAAEAVAAEAAGDSAPDLNSNSNLNSKAGAGSNAAAGSAGGAQCQVRVRVLPDSSSPGQGHKFKVVGLTTSATSIWHIEEIFKTGQDPSVG